MCPVCHEDHGRDVCEVEIDRQGRALADLLDSGRIDGRLRAEIIGAKSSAGWSAAARALVEGR